MSVYNEYPYLYPVKRFVLSIERHSHLPSWSLPFIALLLPIILVVSLLLPKAAFAVEGSVLGIGGSKEESASEPTPDSFGRDSPRHTVQGFISALGENDFLLASNYLNLSKSDNPTTIVRQFKQALDAGGRFQADLQINNTVEGNLTDQLPPSQEKVGSINIGEKSVPLLLERVVSKNGEQYWQFSSETLSSIPEVIENTQPTLISRYTFDGLENKKLFGYQVTDLTAVITITIGSFLLTYVLVWLLYHLLNIVYPRVRGVPLGLPDKVILPLAVVIMALMLSEIMVFFGVSVTLREPVNRFTDIASWVATTWLLLRVIDSIFTRAVNLSYKKNYIERVSILGLMRKIVKALLLIFAIIVIFGNLGFDLTTGIAALGVGGLALALGAQKTIENLVGSVVVVADSPVRIGDYCKFGTYEGTVVDIGIRSSRVRTLNRTIVTVPNGDFSSMQIENFTSRDMFHFLHHLYIKRNADIDVVFKMVEALSQFLDTHKLTNQEWNQANISELRQDCYVIQLRAYVNAVSATEFYGKQDILLVDVLSLVKNYNVEQALPTQQLLVNPAELKQQLEKATEDNIEKGERVDAKGSDDDSVASASDEKSLSQFVNLTKPPAMETTVDNADNQVQSDKVTINKNEKSAVQRQFRHLKKGFRFAKVKKHEPH